MTIQLVGGSYHGESLEFRDGREIIEMPPIRGVTVQPIPETGEWFPTERYQRLVYRNTGISTVVAGESRWVFVYAGR